MIFPSPLGVGDGEVCDECFNLIFLCGVFKLNCALLRAISIMDIDLSYAPVIPSQPEGGLAEGPYQDE